MSPRKKPPSITTFLTRRALADLREIERYSLQQWGRKTANTYLDNFALALDRIRENPEILRLEPGIAPDLFFYRVGKHFLVCDFHGKTVVVLTIVHTSMDLPSRLSELEPRLFAEAELLHRRLRKKSDQD